MLHASSPRRVLLVDADERQLADWALAAREHGFDAATATVAADAMARMERQPYNIVAVNLELAGLTGRTLIEELCAAYPDTTFIAIDEIMCTYVLPIPSKNAFKEKVITIDETPRMRHDR